MRVILLKEASEFIISQDAKNQRLLKDLIEDIRGQSREQLIPHCLKPIRSCDDIYKTRQGRYRLVTTVKDETVYLVKVFIKKDLNQEQREFKKSENIAREIQNLKT
ncbi:MAG: hypothetical protein AAB561_01490 [Patescibacteria group bacterium]|mgnify:CR=1 FL=1